MKRTSSARVLFLRVRRPRSEAAEQPLASNLPLIIRTLLHLCRLQAGSVPIVASATKEQTDETFLLISNLRPDYWSRRDQASKLPSLTSAWSAGPSCGTARSTPSSAGGCHMASDTVWTGSPARSICRPSDASGASGSLGSRGACCCDERGASPRSPSAPPIGRPL